MPFHRLNDPTYNIEEIQADPIWKLAFFMSELENDTAPIGWSQYIQLAQGLLANFELKEKK